jgi:hypothetical protein
MELTGDGVPARSVVAGIALAVGLTAFFMVAWWNRRAMFIDARERAQPACAEKLGEDACRAHLAQYHDDCARLTYHQGGNRSLHGPKSFVDQAAYLECVVLGVDGWVEGNRVRKEAEDRARTTPIPGH